MLFKTLRSREKTRQRLRALRHFSTLRRENLTRCGHLPIAMKQMANSQCQAFRAMT